jgi:hypothetical protein
LSINIVPEEIIYTICRQAPSIIVAMELKDQAITYAKAIASTGKVVMVHHGCGQTPESEFFESINKATVHVGVRENIKKKVNGFGYNCDFVAHPYFPNPVKNKSSNVAASISRIDFVKNTHVIAASNEISKNKIHIYGSENRLYSHLKIEADFPKWKVNYLGEFNPSQAVGIASNYSSIVDLTRIKEDGGGLQYTHLEAIDAGCCLILHRDWLTKDSSFVHGYNCLAVANEFELSSIVDSNVNFHEIARQSKELMNLHNFSEIGKKFISLIG